MTHKSPTQKITSLFQTGSAVRSIIISALLLLSQTIFAQGGTHPGFDPDFGLFAPLENKLLLGTFVVGAIAAIYLFKSKKQKNK